MKRSELRKLIREESRKILSEAPYIKPKTPTNQERLAWLAQQEKQDNSDPVKATINTLDTVITDPKINVRVTAASASPIESYIHRFDSPGFENWKKDLVKYFGSGILNSPVTVQKRHGEMYITIQDPEYKKRYQERSDAITKSLDKEAKRGWYTM